MAEEAHLHLHHVAQRSAPQQHPQQRVAGTCACLKVCLKIARVLRSKAWGKRRAHTGLKWAGGRGHACAALLQRGRMVPCLPTRISSPTPHHLLLVPFPSQNTLTP